MGELRLFVALDVPEQIKNTVSEGLKAAKERMEGIRWVKPENIHLTLKFIGGYEEEKLDKLVGEIHKIAQGTPGFRARLGGCGAFPSPARARVIWVDMREGGEEAAVIARSINSRLGKLGVGKEKRPFRGHLTLGRLKRPKDCSGILEIMEEELEGLADMPFDVREVVLYRSVLSPQGPTYIPLRSIELGGE